MPAEERRSPSEPRQPPMSPLPPQPTLAVSPSSCCFSQNLHWTPPLQQSNTNQLKRSQTGHVNLHPKNPELSPGAGWGQGSCHGSGQQPYPPQPALKTNPNKLEQVPSKARTPLLRPAAPRLVAQGQLMVWAEWLPTSAGTLQWGGKREALCSAAGSSTPKSPPLVSSASNQESRSEPPGSHLVGLAVTVSALPARLGPPMHQKHYSSTLPGNAPRLWERQGVGTDTVRGLT